MVNLHYSKKTYTLPESLNELSDKQLIAIAGLQHSEEAEDVAKLKALQILLGYSTLRFALLPADLKERMTAARPNPRSEASPQPSPPGEGELKYGFVDFVFSENKLTEQIIPTYKGYYGPAKEFDNLTLAEFHNTEVNYHLLVNGEEDEKDEALNNIVAVLYRKPKPNYDNKRDPDGDIRLAFNANEMAFYAKKVAKWPLNVKLAVLMYYDGCRQYLANQYNQIFGGSGSDDNRAGLFGIMRGLAGTKYGDFDKIEHLNIHTAMSDLEEQIEEANKIGSGK